MDKLCDECGNFRYEAVEYTHMVEMCTGCGKQIRADLSGERNRERPVRRAPFVQIANEIANYYECDGIFEPVGASIACPHCKKKGHLVYFSETDAACTECLVVATTNT